MAHRIIKSSIFVLLLSIFLGSCYYSNEDEVYGQTTCDITKAKYSQRVAEIMATNCNSCHGPGLQEGGIRVDSYSALSGFAQSGLLLDVIRHESGVVAMPYALPKLSDCNIAIIEEWVKNGALND